MRQTHITQRKQKRSSFLNTKHFTGADVNQTVAGELTVSTKLTKRLNI